MHNFIKLAFCFLYNYTISALWNYAMGVMVLTN